MRKLLVWSALIVASWLMVAGFIATLAAAYVFLSGVAAFLLLLGFIGLAATALWAAGDIPEVEWSEESAAPEGAPANVVSLQKMGRVS